MTKTLAQFEEQVWEEYQNSTHSDADSDDYMEWADYFDNAVESHEAIRGDVCA